MKIIILGSGTMTSLPKRNPAGYLLQDEDSTVLVDVGPGIVRQLTFVPFDLTRIRTIAITHFHPDHYSDLLPLLMARFLMQRDVNRNLTIIGPAGLKKRFENQAQWEGKWLNSNLPSLLEWEDDELLVNGWTIRAVKTLHTDSSLAYRLERNGRSIFFSGDTDWQKEVALLASGTDVAFFECSLPNHLKQKGHLTPKETGELAQLAKPKRLVATHIYPENDTADLQEQIATYFDGPITIAEDFMQITI